jgi:hypothetical protein
MLTSRRRAQVAALSVILALLSGGSLGAACVGWSDSAMARMTCCHGEGHGETQAAADSCCVMGEQRQGGDRPTNAANISLPIPAVVSFPPLAVPLVQWLTERASWSTDLPVGSPPDTHLLLSVFLI